FYTSTDLKAWKFTSRIGGFFECPDLFELPIDGDPKNTRWVLSAADGDYLIGRFDGETFVPEGEKQRGNYGNVFYAAQTFSDIPVRDNRRIQIGWARLEHPGMPFNQMMTFPCALTLRSTSDGVRLCALPVREIQKLHANKQRWKSQALKPGDNLLSQIKGDGFDIRAQFLVGQATQIGFNVRGTEVLYDVAKQELSCGDRKAPLKLVDGNLQIQILVDRTSLEIFADNGLVYMPMGNVPKDDNKTLALFVRGGNAALKMMEVNTLKSAWPQS
ncbi:MAG: fructan beta-fructosidase, partial [Abditibacteriota bacterium]|nr:fructan beta-fructosidase [Abditibacteriota bacterium]